jgi:tetratricopeptide (TPR) repeat protein
VPLSADPAEINRLLEDADLALAAEHFTFPARDSALALFDRVLVLDPGNETALRGLETIAEHYLALATDAASRRRFEQAQAFVEQAQMVDPEHPGIRPAMEQISLLSSARRTVVQLDPDLLKARDPLLIESLRRAGRLGRQPGCRAVIHGRSDAEGRWIYQQMSTSPEAEGGERIRASLQISWPARIEVLCFPDRASN